MCFFNSHSSMHPNIHSPIFVKSAARNKPDSVSRTLARQGRQPSVYATNTRNSSAACSSIIPYLVLLRKGFALRPVLSDLPGGLLPRLFTLAALSGGGMFSVALSFPRNVVRGILQRRTSCTAESGLSSPATPFSASPERLPSFAAIVN